MEYKRSHPRQRVHPRTNPRLRENPAPAIHQKLPDRARRTRNPEEISRSHRRRNHGDLPKQDQIFLLSGVRIVFHV